MSGGLNNKTGNPSANHSPATRGGNQTIDTSQVSYGFMDVQKPHIPDAMLRIKMKNHQNYENSVYKKKRMAQQLENSRAQVLNSYNIKTII